MTTTTVRMYAHATHIVTLMSYAGQTYCLRSIHLNVVLIWSCQRDLELIKKLVFFLRLPSMLSGIVRGMFEMFDLTFFHL